MTQNGKYVSSQSFRSDQADQASQVEAATPRFRSDDERVPGDSGARANGLHHRQHSRIIVEAAKLDNYEAYRERLSDFLENNNELGIAALAQYVAHRKIILDLFERALSSADGSGRYPLERILHQIIFPMRSSTDDTFYSQQNLWLLDERLNSYGVIHSDRQLKSIDGLESNSSLRPDLIAFDHEYLLGEGPQPLTNLTVVEFKRPMRDD